MPEPTREALARVFRDLLGGHAYTLEIDGLDAVVVDGQVSMTDLAAEFLSEFLVVPRRYLDREELRDVPFGTLMEREDGQVWQRVDALLAVRVWPDEGADGGPSGPLFPARVIWQPPQSSVGSPEEEGQG